MTAALFATQRVEAQCGSPLRLYDTVGNSVARNANGEPKEYYSIVAISRLERSKNSALIGWVYLDDHGFLTAQLKKPNDKDAATWLSGGRPVDASQMLFHMSQPLPDWLKLASCDLGAR